MHGQLESGRPMHGAFIRAEDGVRSFEGVFLSTDRMNWSFRGPEGRFTVDPKQIIWCFPRGRPGPPEGWVVLRRAAKHLAGNLFADADRTQAYELLARLASNLLHDAERNASKPG